MNLRIVIKTVSLFIIFLASSMLLPLICAFIYHEKEWIYFFNSILLSFFVGGLGFMLNKSYHARIFKKEGFAIVGFGWMLGSFFGSLPFCLSGVMSVVDAYFETVSGFTTTGATILQEIGTLPKCILFWRSLTQWLGGMGIIVLFVAVFPFLGVSGKQLFRSESSASTSDGIKPKIRETAQRLWYTYLGLTIAEILLLSFGGVTLFDAICHTFTTLATGGFSTFNTSIQGFNSIYVEIIIIIFMIFAGINFFVLYHFFTGKIKKSSGISEVLTYLSIIGVATILVILSLVVNGDPDSFWTISRKALFQVTSIITTTGYVTDNYELWPSFCKLILVLLMFVGSCAGSTGGGIKIIRFQIAFKFMFNQIVKAIHPGAVKSVKISGYSISDDNLQDVLNFFILSLIIIVFFTLVMAATGLDVITAFTSVAATLWNIGPGLAKVGAIENYGFICDFGKLMLSICMILGRLEFFAIIVLFFPSFWKK